MPPKPPKPPKNPKPSGSGKGKGGGSGKPQSGGGSRKPQPVSSGKPQSAGSSGKPQSGNGSGKAQSAGGSGKGNLSNIGNRVRDGISSVQNAADEIKNFVGGLQNSDAALRAAAILDQALDEKYQYEEKNFQNQALREYKNKNPYDQRLVKAALIPRGGEKVPIIQCMFNPTHLSFSREVSISNMEGARTQRGLPKVNFGFVEPLRLTLSGLLFDTYETGESVLKVIEPILKAVDFATFTDPQGVAGKGLSSLRNLSGIAEYGAENLAKQPLEVRRPPVYYFIWGENNYMKCMIKQLTYKLTMFSPNGTPVRAVVDLSLEEVDLGVADRKFSKRNESGGNASSRGKNSGGSGDGGGTSTSTSPSSAPTRQPGKGGRKPNTNGKPAKPTPAKPTPAKPTPAKPTPAKPTAQRKRK